MAATKLFQFTDNLLDRQIEELVRNSWGSNGVYWKDDILPLANVTPVGPSLTPVLSTDGEGWLFHDAQDEGAVIVVQISHGWEIGASIKPHIHWQKTTDAAGDVEWELYYDMAENGGDFSGAYTPLATAWGPIADTVDNGTANRLLITPLGEIDMSAVTTPSAMIKFRISRIAGSGANDTYGGDVKALSFDYHYRVNAPGGRDEYTK